MQQKLWGECNKNYGEDAKKTAAKTEENKKRSQNWR